MVFVILHSDINECVVNTSKCHEDSICKNKKGAYNCTCKSGYEGDGFNCTGRYLFLLSNCAALCAEMINSPSVFTEPPHFSVAK